MLHILFARIIEILSTGFTGMFEISQGKLTRSLHIKVDVEGWSIQHLNPKIIFQDFIVKLLSITMQLYLQLIGLIDGHVYLHDLLILVGIFYYCNIVLQKLIYIVSSYYGKRKDVVH